MKKAQYFVTCRELPSAATVNELTPQEVRRLLTAPKSRRRETDTGQLTLF